MWRSFGSKGITARGKFNWRSGIVRSNIYCNCSQTRLIPIYLFFSPFGSAYHGVLDHKAAERLLDGMEAGNFLIRRSGPLTLHYTLSVRFSGRTKHFKLYYERDTGQFYLKQQYKHFHSIDDLVEDGLVLLWSQGDCNGLTIDSNCSSTTTWRRSTREMS